MKDQGWISIHRKIQNSFVWTDPNLLKLWLYCLMKARHTDGKIPWNGNELTLSSGEFVTGTDTLAFEFNKGMSRDKRVSPRSVWRWVHKFEKNEMLTIKSTTQYSVISITNWGQYQGNDKRMSNESQTSVIPVSTNNNVNNDNKNHRSSVDDRKPSLESNFNLLWKLYPRKEGKKKALDAYKRAIKKGVTNKQIQDGIVAYKKQLSLNDTPKEFTKQGGTWFFNFGWDDDYSTEPQGLRKQRGFAERERTATDAAAEQAADLERLEKEAKRRLNE